MLSIPFHFIVVLLVASLSPFHFFFTSFSTFRHCVASFFADMLPFPPLLLSLYHYSFIVLLLSCRWFFVLCHLIISRSCCCCFTLSLPFYHGLFYYLILYFNHICILYLPIFYLFFTIIFIFNYII